MIDRYLFKLNIWKQKPCPDLDGFCILPGLVCKWRTQPPVLSVSVNRVPLHRSLPPCPPSLSPNQFRMPPLVALMWREILPQSTWECACTCAFSFLLSDLCFYFIYLFIFFSQICNEKIAKGGGWGESSQRPPMPKVMGAIILRDVRDAGLSQSERMDNKYAKWVNALTHPPLQPPTPTHPSLHHILTNNQLDPRDSAVHLSRLGRYLALPKGMNVTRCV